MANPFDHAPDRRDPNVRNKWTWYPRDVIPMWVADMDFRSPPAILAELRKAVDLGVFGYELPSHPLLETMAGRMRRLYDWDVDPDMVVPVTGIVSGFNVAIRALCTAKKGYLIQPPVYNEFFPLDANLQVPRIEAPLRQRITGNLLRYEVDWEDFDRQARQARVFLLCNPHNPVGKLYSRADLSRMAEICAKHDVLIISDEIHSELLLGGQEFHPLAKLSADAARRSITLISPSKTFNVPGLFCGFAVVADPELRQQFAAMVDRLRLHVSSMGLRAARAAFSGKCDAWLTRLLAYLTANRDYLIDYVTKYLPDIRITQPEATYLAWLDCSELVRQGRIHGTPFEFFLKEAKVALGEGRIYGEASSDFVRLNFGCTRRTLTQALDRVHNSLYGRKHG